MMLPAWVVISRARTSWQPRRPRERRLDGIPGHAEVRRQRAGGWEPSSGRQATGENGAANPLVDLSIERDDGVGGETIEDWQRDSEALLGHAFPEAEAGRSFTRTLDERTCAHS